MKNKKWFITALIIFLTMACNNKNIAQIKSVLQQRYNLAGERTKAPQFFILETTLQSYNPDGTRAGKNFLKLYLKCSPVEGNVQDVYKYTCAKFVIKYGDSVETTVPSLVNWSYKFESMSTGLDEKGQVFGIEHGKFENLTDSSGKPISPEMSYWIYNSFIDFHAFCNVFAEPTRAGNGIQALNFLNQRIIHLAANTEAPVNLGSNVEKGSFFKNGEITLTFTGLGIVNDASCAIVTFDSGESSFKMKMKPMPNMEVTTLGSSHYKGNLFINLKSFWVEKVVMDEFVVSETTVPTLPNKIDAVTERNTVINNVDADQFVKQ